MKKRIKRKLVRGEPHNFHFWCTVLTNPDEVKSFIKKGDKRQKDCIRLTLQYIKVIDSERFNELNGSKVIKQLNLQENGE